MRLSSDQWILWQQGHWKINATIAITWLLMLLLGGGARLATRRLVADDSTPLPRWQSALEIVVLGIEGQIREAGLEHSREFIAFIGTLFLFLATANLLTIFPYYEPPTGSLSTTTALALCVFGAVPLYGVRHRGLQGYLRSYCEPTIVMLPFNVIGEISRTFALAVRLFGNMMSGSMVIVILLSITPLFFPVVMNLLGLLTGMVQAYIFSVLAVVYIAAASQGESA